MKISKEYGPQYDETDGTIGNLQLVKRYAITGKDGVMIYARQGRFTYATEKEAEELRQAMLNNNHADMFPNGLFVECFWCYPNHFDPVRKVPTSSIKTRKDYLDGKCTHSEYYAQFVTEAIKDTVKRRIGIDKLMKSKDEHLNDIPLQSWDNIAPILQCQDMKPYGDFYSLAGGVCVCKEAARQIIKEAKGGN